MGALVALLCALGMVCFILSRRRQKKAKKEATLKGLLKQQNTGSVEGSAGRSAWGDGSPMHAEGSLMPLSSFVSSDNSMVVNPKS